MTVYTLGFANPSYGAYPNLDWDELHTLFYEQVQESIANMGSDGYELDATIEDAGEAHQKGIDQATQECFPRLWRELRSEYKAKLPDGVVVVLTADNDEED